MSKFRHVSLWHNPRDYIFCEYRNKHWVKSVHIRNKFWSVFSHMRTEYGEILRIPPYSARMRKIRTRKTSNADTFHAVKWKYIYCHTDYFNEKSVTLQKKWIFSLDICLVNMNKSIENCGFADIYRWNVSQKTLIFKQCSIVRKLILL